LVALNSHQPTNLLTSLTLSHTISLALDQVKLISVLLLSYVFAQVHALLPYAYTLRASYALVVGLLLGWFLVGYEMLHLIGTATVAYALLALLPRRLSVWAVVGGAFVYLVFVCHLYRMMVAYMIYSLDFTGSQMLLTLKLAALAFNLYDGRADADDARLDAHQRRYRLAHLPDLLSFYSFVFCYLGFYTGPIVEYRDYVEFCDGSMFAALPGRKPTAGRYIAALKAFATALVAAGVLQTLGQYYPRHFVLGSEFAAMPLLQRAVIMWIYTVATRMPYYFGWKLSEGSAIVAGLGFSGVDAATGDAVYERCNNCNVWQVESAQNVKTVTDGWNLGVDHWLKHYVYARVKQTKFASFDVTATLTVSAIWHGLYPGYYLSFLTAALLIQVARLGRRVCRPYFVTADDKPTPLKPLYDVATFVAHQFVFNYTMVPFVMLSFSDSVYFWNSLAFGGHVLLVLGYALFTLAGRLGFGAGKAPRTRTVNVPAPDTPDAKAAPKGTAVSAGLKHRDTPHPSKTETRAPAASSSPYGLRSKAK
jgi:lysophospholipid acyltransferase